MSSADLKRRMRALSLVSSKMDTHKSAVTRDMDAVKGVLSKTRHKVPSSMVDDLKRNVSKHENLMRLDSKIIREAKRKLKSTTEQLAKEKKKAKQSPGKSKRGGAGCPLCI